MPRTKTRCDCTPGPLGKVGCLCAFKHHLIDESPENERRTEEAAIEDLARSHLEEQADWDAEEARDLVVGWG